MQTTETNSTGWLWEFQAEIRTDIDGSVVWSGIVRVPGFEDTDDNEAPAARKAREIVEARVEYDQRINPSVVLGRGVCVSEPEEE